MPSSEQNVRVYEDLAHWYERQGQAKQRDWFLVLAADTALRAGRADEAERLRGRLLHVNPHHLLKPFDSFADALKSPDVQGYVADLRRIYPPETAQQMLQQQRQPGAEDEEDEHAPRPFDEPARPAPPVVFEEEREGPEVQVFRLEAGPEGPRAASPPPRQAQPARPAPRPAPVLAPPPLERPAPPPPPRPAPAPAAPRPRATLPAAAAPTWTAPVAPPRQAAPSAPDEDADPTSAWVALALFVLLLAGGLAVMGYVVLRPLFAPGL